MFLGNIQTLLNGISILSLPWGKYLNTVPCQDRRLRWIKIGTNVWVYRYDRKEEVFTWGKQHIHSWLCSVLQNKEGNWLLTLVQGTRQDITSWITNSLGYTHPTYYDTTSIVRTQDLQYGKTRTDDSPIATENQGANQCHCSYVYSHPELVLLKKDNLCILGIWTKSGQWKVWMSLNRAGRLTQYWTALWHVSLEAVMNVLYIIWMLS